MENVYKSFSHYESPVSDFERGRTQIATPFDFYDLDLSTANTNLILPIAGDFLYIDMASTGVATIELNNQQEARKAPFQVRKGFALQAVFKQLKISNTAQPGLFLRITSSVGERVIPALGDMNISGSVTTLEDALIFNASYKSSSGLAANTADVIFSPAANLNGAIVHRAQYISNQTASTAAALIAKNAAPANVLDGNPILAAISNGGGNSMSTLEKPILIPAGQGLYRISTNAENVAYAFVLYTFK